MANQITAENISPITHNQIPVITTELLASLYGTDSVRIRQNHYRNEDRFIEGKHYFLLEGDKLRDLKHKVSQSYSVKIARNVRSLILWTERGAARHAKMLETDQAWEVFEKLEDCYFSQKDNATTVCTTPDTMPEGTRGVVALWMNGSQVVRSEYFPGIVYVGTLDYFAGLIQHKGGIVLWSEEQQREFVRERALMRL